MRLSHWFVSGILLASTGAGSAVNAESLEQALAAAYTDNPTLLSERAKLRVTDELVPQALSNWRPNVSVSGSYARNKLDETFGGTSVPTAAGAFNTGSSNTNLIYGNETVGVTVTQPIFRGFRTVAQTRQAEAQVQAERALLQATEGQVLLNAATAYLNLVQAQAVLQLSINNEQVLQRQLDAVEDRFRVGEVTRTDVAQAQSRLSAAHADHTRAEGDLRTARAAYVQNIGHASNQAEFPTAMPVLPGSLEQAEESADSGNPTIVGAKYAFDAAMHGIDLVAGELLPTVQLQGVAQRQYNFSGPRTLENIQQAVISVTVPLYQQGQEYSRLRAQKQTAGEARNQIDLAARDARESLTAAWDSLQAGKARRLSYDDQIKAAEIALEGVQRESQVGSRTVLDVLNAEQELLSARVNKVQAQHDEILAAYQLLNATGQMTAARLGLAAETYDPVRHYDEVRDKWIGFGDMPDVGDKKRD